jgi:hypothetical protein
MKKAVNAINGIALGALVIATMFSASAIAGERQRPSGRPFLELQQQIDVLNKCRQPVLRRLQVELLRDAVDKEAEPGRIALGVLLGTSLVGRELQEDFLSRYLARHGSLEDFWKSLEEDSSFTGDVLYEIRLTLFLGRLTHYQLPLLEGLGQLRQEEGLTTLRDISNLTRERWRELLAESDADLDPESFIRRVDRTFDALLFGGCN